MYFWLLWLLLPTSVLNAFGIQMLEYSSTVYAIIFQGANIFCLDDNSFKEGKKKKEGEGNNYRKAFKVPMMLIFFFFQFQNDDLYNLSKSFF